MILTEEDTPQRPKLPMDPSTGPTNRMPPQLDVATSSVFPRPPSPNPTLPGYEMSQAQQAQQPSTPKQWEMRRFLNGRVRKVVLYALVIYSSIAFVIGIPTFLLVSPPFQQRISLYRTITGLNSATGVERTPQVQMGSS